MTPDERFMALALTEAKKGLGLTSINPPVGAVVVRGSRVINAGHHRKAGTPHAEINAMAPCTPRQLRGATLYITLEPCSSHGKTPPCTEAIIAAGIKRVVYACIDPNPVHTGGADRLLRKNGIEMKRGVLRKEGLKLIRPWAQWALTGMPWVIAKAGTSLDGRLTKPKGEPQWITSPASRKDAQQLRRRAEAIIIGAGTLRADDPSLTVRGAAAKGKTQPLRVVLAGEKRINRKAQLFTDRHAERTVVYKNQSLKEVLADLGGQGITTVLIEGGGKLLGEAFAKGLVDEAHFYIAPLIAGSACVPSIAHPLAESVQLYETEITPIGKNVKMVGYPRK